MLDRRVRREVPVNATMADVLRGLLPERAQAKKALRSVRPLDGVQEAVTFPLPKGLKLDQQGESQLGHMS